MHARKTWWWAVALLFGWSVACVSDSNASRTGTHSTQLLPSPPQGPLRITGVVRDARGPVAGVELTATRVGADSLSQRPCPSPERALPLQTPLEHCFQELAHSTAHLVEARAGEAPLFARTVTAADGTFVLEGLPPGAFTLWALGDTGAAVRTEVQAGSEGVAFSLGQGFFLSGTVEEDDNARTAIPGAWVTVVHESASHFFRVLADDKGRFRIGPLPPGRYLKVAGAEGRVARAFREDVWLNSDVAVTLELERKRRLEGVVLSQEGRPASGMTVYLRPNAEFGETLTTRSDAQGRFAFDGIPADEYTAWAWSDGQTAFGDNRAAPSRSAVIRMQPSTFIEGTVKNEQGRPLSGVLVQAHSGGVGDGLPPETVTDGAGHYRLGPLINTAVDISIKGDHYRVRREQLLLDGARTGPWDFTLTSGQSVEGTLVDSEDKPVPGMYLALGRDNASGGFSPAATNFEDAFGRSDEAGRFVVGALDAGRWTLFISTQGIIPMTLPMQVPSTGVRLVLDRGASVSGTVTDATGQPLPEVRVGLWSSTPSNNRSQPEPDPIPTDSHGAFSLSGLKPGRYVLEAWHRTPGAVQWVSRTLDLKERAHADVALRFEEGRTLHGVTTDAAGQPLPGVWVQACLSPEDSSAGLLRDLSCVSTEDDGVRSGPDGRFTLKHLTAPVYQLVATRKDLRLAPGRSRGGTPGPLSLRVPAGADDIRLVMEPAPRLRARVVDQDGAPLPSKVWIQETTTVIACPSPPDLTYVEHSPDGRFALPLPVDRPWDVTVSAKGFLGLERRIEMSPGQDIDLGTVKLLRGRKVRFVILDEATRAPLAGAGVSIELTYALNVWPYEVALPPSFRGNLDMEGTAEFEDLPIFPIHFKVMTEPGLPYREGIVDTRQDVVTVTLPAPGR